MQIQTTVLPGRDRLALIGLPPERFNLAIDYHTIYRADRKTMPGAVAFLLDKEGACRSPGDFISWKNRRCSGVRLRGDSSSFREEFAIYPHYLKAHVRQVIFCFTGNQSLWPEQSMRDVRFIQLRSISLRGEQRLLADYGLPDLGRTSVMQIAILSSSRSGWTLSAEPLSLRGSLEDVCKLFKALPVAN